jgi:hypothetical protein
MLSLIYDDESQKIIPHDETNRNLSFVLEEVFGVGGCGSREEKPRDAGTEADLLRQWAIEHNRFLNRDAFDALWNARVKIGCDLSLGETSEHHVILDGLSGRVIKITMIDEIGFEFNPTFGHAGFASEYLRQLWFSNQALGDDIVLHGLVDRGDGFYENGAYAIVISQKFCEEVRLPAARDIEEAMKGAGFRFDQSNRAGNVPGEWFHDDANLRLWDHAPANFILTESGIAAIDVHVKPADESRPADFSAVRLEFN